MKIVVFGANGRTGRHVVEHAVRREHEVRAFVRSSKHLRFDSNKVDVVEGNVNNFQDVRAAAYRQDVIISAIGHRRGVDPDMQTNAMYHVIGAAHNETIPKRVVSLTTTAAKFKGDKFSLLSRLINLVIRIVDYNRITDGIKHAEVLSSSNLNWTFLRVAKLSNGKRRGPKSYKLRLHGPPKLIVSRRDVANILVKLAETKKYVRKAPMVSRK